MPPCPFCGEEIPNGAKFCRFCGSLIPVSSNPEGGNDQKKDQDGKAKTSPALQTRIMSLEVEGKAPELEARSDGKGNDASGGRKEGENNGTGKNDTDSGKKGPSKDKDIWEDNGKDAAREGRKKERMEKINRLKGRLEGLKKRSEEYNRYTASGLGEEYPLEFNYDANRDPPDGGYDRGERGNGEGKGAESGSDGKNGPKDGGKNGAGEENDASGIQGKKSVKFLPILDPGHAYMLKEGKPHLCFQILHSNVGKDRWGLCITRTSPKRIAKEYDLSGSRILWLTDRESTNVSVIPPSLERITYDFRQDLKDKKNVVFLLDGLEYLISVNSFGAVVQFVRYLVDDCAEYDASLLISINPDALGTKELNMLERELDIIDLPQ